MYSYEAKFIQSLLSASRKRLASQFDFIYRCIDEILSINNSDNENCLGQTYHSELLLPSWICSCQSVGTVNFTPTFSTSVTISISTLQTFRILVATSLVRHLIAFLSHNLSASSGLFLLWMRAVRLSNKLIGLGYVKERLRSSLR